jgi:carboxyl-terminal processing protease
MKHPARRSSLIVIVVLALGALVGGLFGGRVQADAKRPEDQLWTFGRVLSMVEERYVGESDSKEMVEDAIAGMLRTLDPHSNYLSAESFSEMRDEQRGKFHGLGIQITKRGPEKPLTIIAPIDDTPADRAGLQSGDIIAEIEGEPTLDLTVHDAVRLLKGDKGTQVTITIERPGLAEPFQVTIERDEIPIESIRLTYMLEPGVGFIRISNFTSTTADELDQAIEQLADEGMDRLILDLRGNPGGLLDQAVQVSERFIPARKLIVYTRGRIPGSNQDFLSKRGVERIEVPLVLLVDGSSASASEIVSGAVQDHDRGLVVGETTFGKGLVQRVIPLRDGGALAVTTAKYYTPSGRLIQRDYADLEEYYLSRGDEVDSSVPSPPDEESETLENREIFYTTSGRKVYGGGGIRPDYVVKSERPAPVVLDLLRENLFFDFSVRYVNTHADLEKGFEGGPELVTEFRSFVDDREHEYEPQVFDDAVDEIALRLRAQIARVKWDQEEESRVLAEADPQVQQALELFDEASDLSHRSQESDSDSRVAELQRF